MDTKGDISEPPYVPYFQIPMFTHILYWSLDCQNSSMVNWKGYKRDKWK